MLILKDFLVALHIISLLILVLLISLELKVAFIQGYLFIILI